MCDSAANSNILTPGDPAISSAPPLILLQSEEEPGEPGKSAVDSEPAVVGTQDKGAVVFGQSGTAAASDNPPSAASLLPSTSAWTGESASESSAASALPDPWNLDQDDKNLFSGFSEEHLSKLDDVLSSDEVVNFLQQTNLNELSAGLEGPSVGATPSSSNTSNIAGAALRLSESGQLSEESLKLDLFDSLPSGSGLPMSQTLAQNIMQLDSMSQDSLREYESVIMNAAVSDHAYAMPSTAMTTPVSFTPPSTTSTITPPSSTDTTFSPRKSARIKQRMDDGKSAFDSDSDFEYYLMPRRLVKKDHSDVSDAEKATSSPASGSPAPSTSTGASTKQKQPKRRSTRIVDLENREKAEKILQENRQKEQEAMAALQKQKEEEEAKTEEGTAASSKEADSPQPAKRGKKQVKKGALLKGKKRKLKQEESTQEEDTEESGTPKAQPNKPAGKGKIAKKKKDEEEEQEEEGESSPKKKKQESETESGKPLKKKKIVKKSLDAKKAKLEKAKGLLQKRKIALRKGKVAVKAAKKEVSEESSDEDDIPLQAIAKLTKNEAGKTNKTIAEKPKKDQKPKTGAPQPKTATQTGDGGAKETKTKVLMKEGHKNDGGDRKKMAEASLKKDPKKRSMSESIEGKTPSKPKDKKVELHKTGAQQQASKGSGDSHGKVTDKSADKSAGSKTEEAATPAKPVKHKHRKSEEVIIDPTVTDLFKPDGVIPSEHMKKDADAAETVGKEGKDAATPSGAKKNTHGTPVHKNADPSSQRPSVDSKQVSGTPHGRSSSVESKTPSGTTPHGRSLSLENKTTAGSSSNGRSLSMESGKAGTSVVHEKGEDKNSSSAKSTSGEGPKNGGDAGPDRKGSVLTKHSGTTPAASHGEHKGTADKKPATSLTTSEGKETSHDSSVKVKSEKDHGREGHLHHKEPHSHHKEARRHSHEKGQAPSHHHHHHHHKEEKKSKEHHKHSHHTTKKEGSQPKEERKSLFEVLTKPEGTVKDQASSESAIKKERKGSTEKHSKAHKERRRTKDDGHESGGDLSYEDDENDSDWEPTNDNSTPYCICRKPHGNRFMICCDKCGEWFHGQCVGISKPQGQQMEVENREWACPTCSGRPVEVKVTVKQETDKVSSSSKNITQNFQQEKGATEGRKKSRSSVDSPKVLKKQGGGKEKWRTQKCVVGDCKRTARLGSVSCSNGCIIQHARLALRQLRLEREKATGQKVTDMRPSEKNHVTVVEHRSGRVLSGSNAPTEAQLELWLETHPTFEVLLSSGPSPATFYGKKKDRRSSSQSSTKKGEDRSETSTPAKKGGGEKHEGSTAIKKEEKKEEDSSASKPPGTEEGPDPVRLNVRKSLRDALSQRAAEADDIMLSSNEIKRMALRIEEELFKLFEGTGNKYRAKFRSLVFNIKDQKNKGLFRKILTRKIRASHLVKMSTEELASKELSKWRKMENKHTLEMIEQMEKEALKEGQQHIRKKTHKGEVEVEEEDMSTLVTRMEEPKSTVESKTEEEASVVIMDTTDQHRAHLFDLNCKICTGKMLPPASEEPVPKKIKVAHQVVEESKPKKSRQSRKKEVTINDRKEVKIVERKADDTVGEEAPTTPSDTPHTLAMSPDTGSTPGSSATSPGPSLSSQSPASTSHGPTLPFTSKVTVRSPDSVLQSGLDPKHKYTPSGPMVWKGFLSMQDFAKFFTSAYRVSGPAEKLGLPDTLQICGRIGPEQMWDYLGKIRQAGSRDICILRFIPGSEDEKSAYVHLYSYLSGRSRCGVVGNPPKYVKDLYIVPLASHSNIPHVLLPFEGPGLEGNRPHMLIGIVVRQKLKRPKESSEGSTPGKLPHVPDKTSGLSSAKKVKPSKEEVTEAYSPTADGDESAGAAAPYIPTPTTSIARVASSTPSSSSSTPSSMSSHSQAKDLSSQRSSSVSAAKEVPLVEDAEPYSPSKPVVEDDEDAPYDPEDLPGMEDKSGSAAAAAAKKPDMVASSAAAAVVVSATTTAEEAKAVVTTTSKAVVTTTAVKADVSSSSVTTPQVSSTPSVSIDTVMDQISASSDPKKISSLMIKVLAGAKDPTEQQHLMATLTSKVGQQKKHQADKPPSAEADPPKADSSLPSTSLWTAQAPSALPATMTTSEVTVASVSSTTKDSVNVSSTTTLPVSAAVKIISSILPGLQTTASATTPKTTPSISSTLFSSLPAVASLSKVSGGPEVSSVGDSKPAESTSRVSSLTPNIDNMPLALKALMEDLKGNTQMVKAVDKRTERDRREREKKEASVKEASETEKKESMKDAPPPKETDSIIPGLGGVKEPDTAIPGLGGVKDESSEQSTGAETSASAGDKDKAEEVSSSTDTRTDRLSPLPTKSDVLQGDVDLRIQGELDARMLSTAHVHDQDDRFPTHLPPPDSMPPPPHSLGFPPPPTSSYMLPAHPPILPPHHALDVPDIDHRRHGPPPSMYPPRVGVAPPAPYRPPAQPPPPGTEVVGEEDVDMRHPPKRTVPPHRGEPPFDKRPRTEAPGPARLVPPLPPLPPQPPPPLPPLPSSSGSVDGGGPAGMEHRDRGDHSHRPPSHEPWPRGHEEGHDFDHRRHHHHHGYSHRGPHHSHHHSHSSSPPSRYRGDRHDRDERHRRDRHFHRR